MNNFIESVKLEWSIILQSFEKIRNNQYSKWEYTMIKVVLGIIFSIVLSPIVYTLYKILIVVASFIKLAYKILCTIISIIYTINNLSIFSKVIIAIIFVIFSPIITRINIIVSMILKLFITIVTITKKIVLKFYYYNL